MKPNVWNIKDILNVPVASVGPKSVKNCTTSDYSSLTDSQYLSGSQFWLENSQSFSQEISGQSKASQEINELKVSNNYHAKPFLFGDSKATNIPAGKHNGILDRFEEEKRKAKENEMLNGIRQLHESLEHIKRTFLSCIDGSCDVTRNAIAEEMTGFRKTIQESFATIKESIAGLTELLMSLQSQTHLKMKDTEAKTTLVLKDLSSLMLSLQKDMESLKVDQSKDQSTLGEILSLLSTLMASYSTVTHLNPVKMTDSTVQTSPSLVAQVCVASEERYYEGMRLSNQAVTHSKDKMDQSMCSVKTRSPEKHGTAASIQGIGTLAVEKQQQAFGHTGTGRSEFSAWQKSYSTRSVPSSAASPVATTTAATLKQDPKRYYVVGAPVQIEPLNDTNENDSTTWTEIPRQKKVSKRGQKCQTFRRKKRALILPLRRSNPRMALDNVFEKGQYDGDQENRVPLSAINAYCKTQKSLSSHQPLLQQQNTTGHTNKGEHGPPLNPWSWSQSSNSSQMIMEYQQAEWETGRPEHKENTIKKQRGGWQLFDFISDSD
ncbi:interactor of HORMAD1 protein 1 isoform X2 [Trichomycterus rosablanca]